MSMKITVIDRKPEAVTTEWQGVKRERVQQWAILEIDGLPTSFQLTSNPGEEYSPGAYELDTKSFNVVNGRLQVQRVVLRRVDGKPATKAA